MKKRSAALALLVCLFGAVGAEAATISYQTRLINKGVNNADYKASWNSQTSAIKTQEIPDFTSRLGGNNTFSRLIVNFTSTATTLNFQLAVDATYGGAIYLDNKLLTKNTTDLWWGYNWNATSEILSVSNKPIKYGNHILEVFWAENCCNGGNSGRFSLGGSKQWQSMSATNLASLQPVPVPPALWLFGTALAGLAGTLRKAGFKKETLAA